MKKRVLITGVNGMDGSYLADFLLSKNYEVYGLKRSVYTNEADKDSNIKHIKNKIHIINGDILNLFINRYGISESSSVVMLGVFDTSLLLDYSPG